MSYLIDIETIPQPSAMLERLMPESMLNPVMPPELANPEPPDLSKCPAYAKEKDPEAKRAEWIAAKEAAHKAEVTRRREAWELACMEARAKFVEDAALHAERGEVKMIGIEATHPTAEGWTRKVIVFEDDTELAKRLDRATLPEGVALEIHVSETSALLACMGVLKQDGHDVISYFGNTFDLPFLTRRASIVGALDFAYWVRNECRRGRYFLPRFVDLHEDWQMGDRQTPVGGLEGLAKKLGLEGRKTGNGQTFYKWYAQNPEEGVFYLLNDLDMTRDIAKRMGVIR